MFTLILHFFLGLAPNNKFFLFRRLFFLSCFSLVFFFRKSGASTVNTVSIMLFFCSFFFVALILAIRKLIGLNVKAREKASPFECGLDPQRSSRIPFSLRFFLLGILFLVLDVELAVLMCRPLLTSIFKVERFLGVSFFILVLIVGLIYE